MINMSPFFQKNVKFTIVTYNREQSWRFLSGCVKFDDFFNSERKKKSIHVPIVKKIHRGWNAPNIHSAKPLFLVTSAIRAIRTYSSRAKNLWSTR